MKYTLFLSCINGFEDNCISDIKKLGIIYPEKQVGHIRFDRLTSSPNTFLLDTIYLMHLTDSYNNKIVLKFNYRDFDYVPGYPWQSSEYKFESIYFMPNQHDEFRYNKDLKLVSKYLHGLLRMHNHHFLAIKTKYPGDSNMLDVAAEWNSYHEKNPLNLFDDASRETPSIIFSPSIGHCRGIPNPTFIACHNACAASIWTS